MDRDTRRAESAETLETGSVVVAIGHDQRMARTGQQMRMRTAKAMARSGGASNRTATTEGSRLGDKLRYRFDNSMSRGTPALIAWLSAATRP